MIDVLAGDEALREDGHDAGLAVRVLARSVHVGVAKGDELQAVHLSEDVAVRLAGELRRAIR